MCYSGEKLKIDRRKYIYLAGAIEHAPDDGRNWRRSVQTFLEEKGFKVINPVTDEIKALQASDVPKDWTSFKKTDIPQYQRIMKQIITFDMDVVRTKASAIIVKWNTYTQMGAGTMAELTDAFLQNIPIIMIHDIPLVDIPGWIIGTVDKFYPTIKHFKDDFDAIFDK